MDISKIISGQNPPDDVNVIVEVPLGGDPIKYEIDKASGAMFVDRYLYTEMRYPCNYGFVPHTLSLDGDPIDVMVVGNRTLEPGSDVRAGGAKTQMARPGCTMSGYRQRRVGRAVLRDRWVKKQKDRPAHAEKHVATGHAQLFIEPHHAAIKIRCHLQVIDIERGF